MVTNLENMDRVNFWPEPGRRPRRVLVAMSGGVDSTFAAWVLKRAGAEVVGVHFKMGDFDPPTDGVHRCCSIEDARDARRMADAMGIPFYTLSVEEAFKKEIIIPFAKAYARGLTPNPCLYCNPRIKWRFLIRKARELQMEAVATGHYARAAKDPDTGRLRLLRGVERQKEQSYFLSRLEPEQLEWAVLPAGWFPKKVVRQVLARAGLAVADKAESQDICFVGPGGYIAAVESALPEGPPPPGEFVDLQGKVLGPHRGIHHYTIGQRRGLSIPRPAPSYVVSIDPDSNRVMVGPREATFSREAVITDLHWIQEPPGPDEEVTVKTRYKSAYSPARVRVNNNETALIDFRSPQRAITPGQAAVIYRAKEVLGGGIFARPQETTP